MVAHLCLGISYFYLQAFFLSPERKLKVQPFQDVHVNAGVSW